MKARTLRIGTRGSLLALQQSQWVRDESGNWPGLTVELQVIKTTGDKILDVPLAKVGGKDGVAGRRRRRGGHPRRAGD